MPLATAAFVFPCCELSSRVAACNELTLSVRSVCTAQRRRAKSLWPCRDSVSIHPDALGDTCIVGLGQAYREGVTIFHFFQKYICCTNLTAAVGGATKGTSEAGRRQAGLFGCRCRPRV
jgi:hypothetical protein